MAGLNRNQWPLWIGISGRFASECAAGYKTAICLPVIPKSVLAFREASIQGRNRRNFTASFWQTDEGTSPPPATSNATGRPSWAGVGSRASVRSCCVARRSAACCCDERPGVWVDPGQIGLGYSGQAAMCALHATPLLCPAAPDHVTRGDLNPSAGRQPEQPSKPPTFLQSAKPEGRTAHDRSYELG